MASTNNQPVITNGAYGSVVKSAAAMSVVTLLSRIFGLIRDMVQAAFLGTSYGADAFRVASMIPNTLRRLFSEGAMTAAFVPTYAEVEKKHDKQRLWRFVNAFFLTFTILLAIIVVTGELLTPFIVDLFTNDATFGMDSEEFTLTVNLTRIIFPYIAFISMASMVMAVLNCMGTFAPSAFTPVIFNIIMIVFALFFGLVLNDAVLGLALGFLIGGFVQFVFQIPFLLKKDFQFKPVLVFNDPYVWHVFRLMIPGLFAVGITQINLMVNTNILSGTCEGALSGIYYSNRLTELAQGIFAVSVATVILPLMSRQAKAGNISEMKQSITFALRMILFIIIPAAIGLAILRNPIVSILFQRGEFDQESISLTADPLLFFSIGMIFFALVKVFVPAFYALKRMHIPVAVSAVDMTVNICLAIWLSKFMGNSGVALALSAGALVNVTLLLIIFTIQEGKISFSEILATLLRTAIAVIVMAGVCILLMIFTNLEQMNPGLIKIALTFATIFAGGGAYFLMSVLLGARELKELKTLLLRRKPVIKDQK